jgi:hypothetical protein
MCANNKSRKEDYWGGFLKLLGKIKRKEKE